MKHLLLTTIAAALLVGCGESQQSATSPESKPVEPVTEVGKTVTAQKEESTYDLAEDSATSIYRVGIPD